jgi:hypothetical protein
LRPILRKKPDAAWWLLLHHPVETNQDQPKKRELAMTLSKLHPSHQTPSRSRMRYVQAQLQSDAEAVLREMAYVLKLTQQVKQEILSEETEAQTIGA